jgi:ribonucleoside-diphosphate reductase alpha chain
MEHQAAKRKALRFERHFTDGSHPFDTVTWKTVDAKLTSPSGEVKFELKDVEVPAFWSQRATNIVAEKYFRVVNGTKETSAKQMILRVARSITLAGIAQGVVHSGDKEIFEEELIHILLYQMFAFNSPVWFNIGVPGVKQQASACFIQEVDDTMESITDLIRKEMLLFKGGSGTGSNLSRLRSSYEKLSGGGEASGPVSFMEVLDAGAGVTKSGGTTRRAAKMVVLNVDHPDILQQKNGRPGFIRCKASAEQMAHDLIDTGKYSGEFNVPGNAYEKVGFQNANNSVRVPDEFMDALKYNADWYTLEQNGSGPSRKIVHTYKAQDLWHEIAQATWFCGDPGVQFDTTTNRWHTCKESGRINASNPCSEYLFLDDTACNLGSFNLLKFYQDGEFNVQDFIAANKVCITAMEILVSYSSYPSESITKNSHDFRPLGIGYANLGALLMHMGLAYDSDEGRNVAASITALMSGACYAQSALIAADVGPFAQYAKNENPMLHVIRMHTQAADRLAVNGHQDHIVEAAKRVWAKAFEFGKDYGYRNSQISVIAPTGTISFLMDCDTTGIEPSLAVVTQKKLVGGGFLSMPNHSVKSALSTLGYSKEQIEAIEANVASSGRLEGVKEEHKKVFQTAIGDDPVSVDGHLLMMAAVQPFLSGGISKTVNMPSTATVREIAETYHRAWVLGLKCVAIYRDGCKRSQPISAKKEAPLQKLMELKKVVVDQLRVGPTWGDRKRLPDERDSITHKFSIGGQEGYLHIGKYEDGTPGEVFINIAKAGSTLYGFADLAATMMSLGLQHGVPVGTIIDKLRGTKFEPSGFTHHNEIRTASSIGDYLAKYLELKFNPAQEKREEAVEGPLKAEDYTKSIESLVASVLSGDTCSACGNPTQRAGSCKVCTSCGTTTGCG